MYICFQRYSNDLASLGYALRRYKDFPYRKGRLTIASVFQQSMYKKCSSLLILNELFLQSSFQDMMGMKMKLNIINPSDKRLKIKFKDVAGLHEAKVEIKEFVDYLRRPERYTVRWLHFLSHFPRNHNSYVIVTRAC